MCSCATNALFRLLRSNPFAVHAQKSVKYRQFEIWMPVELDRRALISLWAG